MFSPQSLSLSVHFCFLSLIALLSSRSIKDLTVFTMTTLPNNLFSKLGNLTNLYEEDQTGCARVESIHFDELNSQFLLLHPPPPPYTLTFPCPFCPYTHTRTIIPICHLLSPCYLLFLSSPLSPLFLLLSPLSPLLSLSLSLARFIPNWSIMGSPLLIPDYIFVNNSKLLYL